MTKKICKSFVLAFKLYAGNIKYLLFSAATGFLIFLLRPLLSPVFLRLIYDSINANSLQSLLYTAGLALAAVIFMIGVAYFLIVYADAWAIFLITGGCIKSYEAIYDLPLSVLDKKYDTGELFIRINQGSDAPASVVTIVIQCLAMVLSLALISVLLFEISPYALILALLMVLFECLRVKYEMHRHYAINRTIQEEGAKLSEVIHTAAENAEQLLFLGETDSITDEFKSCLDNFWDAKSRDRHVTLSLNLMSDTVFALLKSVSFGALSTLPRFPLGALGSLNSMIESFRDTACTTIQFTSELPGYLAKTDRIDELLSENSAVQIVASDNTVGEYAVQFSNVSLSFDRRIILKNVSFAVHCGDKVAIIGENGSGKSTILKLMLGNLPAESGSIHVLGKPPGLHKHIKKLDDIGYVPVESRLFSVSAQENIAMGSSSEEVSVQIQEDFITQNAAKLSAGQKKRINILRGMQKHGKLLIADEPDAELDLETARKYTKALTESADTVISVTHNQQLFDMFDYLLVLSNGKIKKMTAREYFISH